MRRPKALDLFCGGGGASMGLHQAGFDVTGVDINPQPHYPSGASGRSGQPGQPGFNFIQADALEYPLKGFDLVWASPPCQAFTAYKRRPGRVAPRPNLIPEMRRRLKQGAQGFWVIENVHGAPLEHPVTLCGSMFGLDVRRHRKFEASFLIPQPPCNHKLQTPRFPQATNRTNLRSTVEVGVWRIPLATQQAAMGIDWLPLESLSQAIPPAYSRFIGMAVSVRLS